MTGPTDVRLLGAAELEAYLGHMIRLDGHARAQRFAAGVDDYFVLSHCLTMVVARTSLIGAFVDGVLRGAAELEIDEGGAVAELALAVEIPWRGRGLGRALAEAAVAEARRRGVARIRLDVDAHADAMHRIAAATGFIGDGGRRSVTYLRDLAPAAALAAEPVEPADTARRWWNPFRAAARTA